MNCTINGCPGEYEPRRISQTYTVAGELIVVSGVPVEVCAICGDTLVTPQTARRIEELVANHGPAESMAPVYSLVAE